MAVLDIDLVGTLVLFALVLTAPRTVVSRAQPARVTAYKAATSAQTDTREWRPVRKLAGTNGRRRAPNNTKPMRITSHNVKLFQGNWLNQKTFKN